MSLVTRMNQCLRLCFAVRASRKAGHSATRSKADWYALRCFDVKHAVDIAALDHADPLLGFSAQARRELVEMR
jgi:hypothetical protein